MKLAPGDSVGRLRPGARQMSSENLKVAMALFDAEAAGNAVVVQRLLAAREVDVGLRTIQRAVAPRRRDQRRAAVATTRYETPPGKQMQIDFGQKWVFIAEARVRVYFFVAVLGYSRRIYAHALLSERLEDWCEGLKGAFEHFEGIPLEILIDNPKAMVLGRDEAGKPILNPGFASFCHEWGLAVKACQPYRARTKGKTESGVKYVKHNAIADIPFASFAALNAHLAHWLHLADDRVHGTTHQTPRSMYDAAERSALRPLPSRPTPARLRTLQRKVANDALVNVDTIRYSVPHRWVGEVVQVWVGDEEVRILAGSEVVARHPRCLEPHGRVVTPEHYDGLWRLQGSAAVPGGGPAPEIAPGGDLAAMGRSLDDYAAAISQGGAS